MHTTKFALKTLIRRLELQNNRDYEYQQIAQACNLSRFTVASIATNSSNRVELRTLDKLLDFFAGEGMPVTLNELLTVVTEDAERPTLTQNQPTG